MIASLIDLAASLAPLPSTQACHGSTAKIDSMLLRCQFGGLLPRYQGILSSSVLMTDQHVAPPSTYSLLSIIPED